MKSVIDKGVLVDRDGPSSRNEFLWRVTFLNDSPPGGSDFKLKPFENLLTTKNGIGSVSVLTSLLVDGESFNTCSGNLIFPSYGGLVKGLEYYLRVTAINSKGYSIPTESLTSAAPVIVPGLPTGVSLDVISASELQILFGPPADNGGDTILDYLIEWSTLATFEDTASTTLEYLSGGSPFFKTIDGLNMGQKYYFRVSARNSQGLGIFQLSTPVFINPHEEPAPPMEVYLEITSDTTLTVGWEAPQSDGGDQITTYRIEWDTKASFTSPSFPPHKGYIDVEAVAHTSYTIELLSSAKVYVIRVFAINRAEAGIGLISSPLYASPLNKFPGMPYALFLSQGPVTTSIDVSWQYPLIPHHGIPCYGTKDMPQECPRSYGGGLFPLSNGGNDIVEYEVEYNERNDFGGSDGGRKVLTGTNYLLTNLTGGRIYYIRVLARNAIGSGAFCPSESVIASQ